MILSPKRQIIVTRPSPYGERLNQSLQMAGFNSQHIPLIEFFDDPSVSEKERLQQLASHDCWIFISQQAVHALFKTLEPAQLEQLLAKLNPSQRVIAVGPATQQALASYGISSAIASRYDSEGILELFQSQPKAPKRTLLIRGNKGRELLEAELPKLSTLSVMPVYKRQRISSIELQPFQDRHAEQSLIVVTSLQLLTLIHQFLQQSHLSPSDYSILCPSDRIAQQAVNFCFKDCYTALSASDDDIINRCHDWLKNS